MWRRRGGGRCGGDVGVQRCGGWIGGRRGGLILGERLSGGRLPFGGRAEAEQRRGRRPYPDLSQGGSGQVGHPAHRTAVDDARGVAGGERAWDEQLRA
eukprot:scaffold2639_cov95-Isochrysis_galbana.AAC.3